VQSKGKEFWLRLAGSILALGLLIYLLTQQGWQQIGAAFNRLDTGHLLAAFVLTLLSRIAISLRWYVLLHSGGAPVNFGQILRITFAGLFASNFLPTTIGGDILRLAGAIQMRIDAAATTASLVVDRMIGLVGMAIPLPAGIGYLLSSGLPLNTNAQAWSGLTAAKPLLTKVKTFFGSIFIHFKHWAHRPGWLGLALLFTLLHQIFLYTSIIILLTGMHEPADWLRVAGIWSLVYFITLLPVSINGYGLQEISATLLYTYLGGISPEASTTIALLVRTMQMAASLPGGFFVPSIAAARVQSHNEHSPGTGDVH
jgi:glycosyltransferase 2 family protein